MSSKANHGESSCKHRCAACKHQRRKCNDACLLHPYFGTDRMNDFQLAQKVFGISNMNKMMKELGVEDRPKAIESLVWEAWLWKQDNVNGPLGHYRKLQQENASLRNQIHQLNQQLQVLNYVFPLSNLQGMVPNNNELGATYDTGSGNLPLDLPLNNINNNVDFSGQLPMNGDAGTPSWPIEQGQVLPRQQNLGLDCSSGTNGNQLMLQTQQRGNPSTSRQANSFYCQANRQGRSGLHQNGQAIATNTNFSHGQVVSQKVEVEFNGTRTVSGYGAPQLSYRTCGRDVRYAPYGANHQFGEQIHERGQRDIHNPNSQHVQQVPIFGRQQFNDSRSFNIAGK